MWGGITLALLNLEMIIVTQLLPEVENKIPNYYLFWFFATVCVCIISFVCSYIPEPKNRELSMVRYEFRKSEKYFILLLLYYMAWGYFGFYILCDSNVCPRKNVPLPGIEY